MRSKLSENLTHLIRLLYIDIFFGWNAPTFNSITNIILCICMQILYQLPYLLFRLIINYNSLKYYNLFGLNSIY